MTNGVLSYWSARLLGFQRAKARFGHAVCMGAGTLLACGGWFAIYTVSLSSPYTLSINNQTYFRSS